MTEETTAEFLARRERELMSRAAALRGQLVPIESELAKVQRMRAVLDEEASRPNVLAKLYASDVIASQTNNHSTYQPSIAGAPENPYATRTIKDLVIQTLLDAYPNGARTAEIRNFMLSGYGRTIDPGSLRTQLHRLKSAGILGQDPSNDLWNFRDGQRALYSRYDHPTSRRNNAKLNDDPTDPQFSGGMPWQQQGDK